MMMNKTLYHDGHFFFSPSASLLSLATNQIGFVTRSILREKNVYIWPSIHWWIAPIVSTISAIWTPRCQRLAWHVVCKLLKRVRTSSLPSLIGSLIYSPKLAVNKYQLLSIYSFSYVPSLVDSSWKGNIVFFLQFAQYFLSLLRTHRKDFDAKECFDLSNPENKSYLN